MSKDSTNSSYWKPGQSGNPNGRPRKGTALTDMLRLKGDDLVPNSGQATTAHEALAKIVWQFVLTGEVWLLGKKLEAQSVGEWSSVVKWLYMHVEPGSIRAQEPEPELVVRVIREDDDDDMDDPLPLAPSPLRREGEQADTSVAGREIGGRDLFPMVIADRARPVSTEEGERGHSSAMSLHDDDGG
jgi:hypothetical protein